MHFLLIALSVVCSSAKSLLSKGLGGANRETYGLARSNTFIFSAALGVIVVYAFVAGVRMPSLFTGVTGVLFAGCIAMAQLLFMSALKFGAVSVTSFIYSSGFLIPTLAGVLYWKETVSVTKIAGTALLLLALFLIAWEPGTVSTARQERAKDRSGLVWRLCAFGAMTCSGMLGLLQKVHQSSRHKEELSSFLLIAMGAAALLSVVLMLSAKKKGEGTVYGAKPTALSLACGAFYGVVNITNLALAGRVPAPLLFPLLNGGGIILTAVLGKLVFRERVSLRKWIGIGIGIAAIIVISR